MDYVTYSKNAFLGLKDEYKESLFALYQPKDNENLIIYANRRGLAHVWRYDPETGVVTITCHTIKDPSKISANTFNELMKIAKRKHWHGGVQKLRHYLRHVGEPQLDTEGLDPFFYAWVIQYDIAYDEMYLSSSDYFNCFDDILREGAFIAINGFAMTIGDKPENLVKEFVVKCKNGGISYDEFVDSVLKRNTRYIKVYNLLDEELPMAAGKETRQKLALDICQLISKTEDALTAE